LNFLILDLVDRGYHVLIETNGSLEIRRLPDISHIQISMDIKCPSSGMADRMLFTNIKWLNDKDQLKFVIADITDYMYAKTVINKYKPICNVIFQPKGGIDAKFIADNVLNNDIDANVRVLVQLHKIIWRSHHR
jgi:7-carboxy-7-deazaguanine synthase